MCLSWKQQSSRYFCQSQGRQRGCPPPSPPRPCRLSQTFLKFGLTVVLSIGWQLQLTSHKLGSKKENSFQLFFSSISYQLTNSLTIFIIHIKNWITKPKTTAVSKLAKCNPKAANETVCIRWHFCLSARMAVSAASRAVGKRRRCSMWCLTWKRFV